MDYEEEFNSFLREKRIDLNKESSKVNTAKGFVKWLMLTRRDIELDEYREWQEEFLGEE